jgi:hypothetical protein
MYGTFDSHKNGKLVEIRAHVYSWELHSGRVVRTDIGMMVCHKCDHPWCVNPDHLFLGSDQDNSDDKVSKGRQSRGSTHPSSKLNESLVKEIRDLFQGGNTTKEQLAIQFGVTDCAIGKIISRKTWKHVA